MAAMSDKERTQGKVEIKIGNLSFTAEGDQEWLGEQLSNGRDHKQLDTTAVAKALTDHQQKRLGNPADCLNQNVAKGFCEKKKDGSFFITPEGWKALG
jgi:uncharacterized protein with von Willebrand factor type A (vWA) domain